MSQFSLKFCPKCGARLKPPARGRSANLCSSCGTPLAEWRPAAPPPSALADRFPFRTMRASQKQVLDDVDAAIKARKKFIILEAPVGFGKSAVAAAVCNHLGSAYVLTSTKQLQDQYSSDFRYPVVIGKSNFTCLVPTSSGKLFACSKGRCEADWTLSDCPHYLSFEQYEEHKLGACRRDAKCEHLKGGRQCAYYEQKWDAFRAPVMVGNYAFLLSELKYTDEVRQRRLLVCDEAHDLERLMADAVGFRLKRALVEPFSDGEPFDINDRGDADPSAWVDELDRAEQALKQFLGVHLSNPEMQDRVVSCKNNLQRLEDFSKDLKVNPANWVVNEVRKSNGAGLDGAGPTVDEVSFQPMEVGAYTSLLFKSADTVLLMSATVFSKGAFCSALGIPEDQAAFIQVHDSSFPLENRRIYALDVARLSYESMDASLGAIARAVDEILSRHSGERGIVHTTNYHQARYIREHVSDLNRARLASSEGVASRTDLIRAHGSSEESVLISPSLYQGVDLKDELARFQVLVKVPFPALSDKRTREKLRRDPGWYDWQTALRLVQTYGRSIRSETDHAVTYVLDSNFTSFVGKHRELFPGYFMDAVMSGKSLV